MFQKKVLKSTTDELAFFATLSVIEPKVGVLSVVSEYSDAYCTCQKHQCHLFPSLLHRFTSQSMLSLNIMICLMCVKVLLTITEEMAKQVELQTRQQAKSSLWYKCRAGRIIASNMKAVCRTDSTNPSKSLVKRICYPDLFAFTSKQTYWGQKHEKLARDEYFKAVKGNHQSLQLKENGLFINPNWPYIGASPDGIVECDCCSKGTVEIKYLCSHWEDSIEQAAISDTQFCLIKQGDLLHLDHSHAYYYQIQAQLFVCNVQYSGFYIFTFGCSERETNIHIEHIQKDEELWKDCITRSEHFFVTCLLPEVLGHWYTRPLVSSMDEGQPS